MKDRRAFLRRAACLTSSAVASLVLLSAPVALAQQVPVIRMVSRERLLREAAIARLLRREEQRMTELLQAQVDQAKVALAGEEAELAGLREQLSPADFDRLTCGRNC